MDKRKIGKKLEEYVSQRLAEALNDSSIRPTKNSGASTQLADILSRQYIVECKKRNTKNITIKEDVWNKLCAEVPINSLRIPVYVLENINHKRWLVVDFEDFCHIIKEKQNV